MFHGDDASLLAEPVVRPADVHAVGRQDEVGRGVDLDARSEEHTSELQSQSNLVCRLLLEKKKEINLPHSSDVASLWGAFSLRCVRHLVFFRLCDLVSRLLLPIRLMDLVTPLLCALRSYRD